MLFEIIALLLLLLASGFFSSSELAFVVSNKIKIEIRAKRKKLTAGNAQYFVENPETFFSTILISNNIINTAFASLLTVFLLTLWDFSDLQILLLSSFLLLLFGELIPKYFAREFADSFIMITSFPLRVITILFYPAVKIVAMFSSMLTRSSEVNEENISHLFDRTDMQSLLEESTEAGIVGETESDIFNKVMELKQTRIYETMTPRTNVVAVDINSPIEEVIDTFISSGYSKLPVFEENIDNIKGLVHTYDMFRNPEDLQSVMRQALFVPDSKKSLELLNELMAKHISIAIVIDEFGGTAGIVTVEDIIEEMFGEIMDEHDTDTVIAKQIDAWNYILSGRSEIDYLNEEYDLLIPEGDYETIAGFITSRLGTIPEKNESFTIEHFKIQILRSDKARISLVKLTVDQEKYHEISE